MPLMKPSTTAVNMCETKLLYLRLTTETVCAGEMSRTSLDLPWHPPSFLYNWYRVNGRGVALNTHPHLDPKLKKE